MKKLLLSLAVLAASAFGASAETLTFTGWDFPGASDWTSSYAEHPVTYDNAVVTFEKANKQSGTITDCPVTKGNNITIAATEGGKLASVTFNLVQWGSKAQTATLYVSTDGTEFSATETSSTNFTLTAATLPAGTVAAQVRFDSQQNQVGCASIEFTLAAAAPSEGITGTGTETDPYKIATKEDLCNAWTKVDCAGCDVYFEQTADIDMAGVTDYHAIAGYNGSYKAVIHYDGKNHLIKNFAPNNKPWSETDKTNYYYCTSVFGVASGEISNLGVVDAKCVTDHGAGILAGYGGNSAATPLIIDNVFVTGEVIGTGGYTGGMIGTNGNIVTMTNCYANVQVSGSTYPGGIIGRASKNVNMENVYVAGTVKSTTATVTPYLVMGSNAELTYNGWQVIAFNSGAEAAMPETGIEFEDEEVTVATAGTEAALIDKVKSWRYSGKNVFSATQTVYGYPGLASFDYEAFKPDGSEAHPYEIATVEDLCNAWTLTKANAAVYFVQTADIDMAGVTEWHALVGWDNATYSPIVHYDGTNHLIKNFTSPNEAYVIDKKNCYNGSIFGVLSGSVKNLGIVDVNINTPQGTGGLAAYGGHSSASAVEVENVFVTGTIKCTTYAGGLFGTMGNNVTIKNSFVNVKLSSTEANTSAALIGRPEGDAYTVTVSNTYAAGTVAANNALLFGEKRSTKTSPAINVTEVVAFNTGSAVTSGTTVTGTVTLANTAETQAAGVTAVEGWAGFSKEYMVKGYPGLAKFKYTAEPDPVVVNTVAETTALAANTKFEIGYDLTVAYVNGINAYAYTADNNFILLYGTNSYKVGDVIEKGWIGLYAPYGGLPEIKPVGEFPAAASNDGKEFVPAVVAAADVKAELANHIIVVNDVVFAAATPAKANASAKAENFTGKVGETELTFRTNFVVEAQEAGTYNVTVAVAVYNEAVQLYPIAYEIVSIPEPEVTDVNTVAETKALATDTKVKVGYALTVAFSNAGNIFACDEAGDFIQVYATDKKNSYKVGDVIPAGWEATYKLYNGVTPELEIASVDGLPAATEGTFTPKAVAAADIAATMVNSVVKVENVVFAAATPSARENFTGKVGETELPFRNNYTLEGVPAGKYNVTVVVNVYQGNVQLYVVEYEKVATDGIDELEADAAEAVYYNLQGVEVKNPANGVYIVRRGTKVSKEYVR